MAEREWLTEQFERNRSHLTTVAFRMLGSPNEADDAVQEAWLRFSRADTREVENLGGWLTTVVSRVCLDMLRARKARREDTFDDEAMEPLADAGDPERDLLLADAIGPALMAVLDTLPPAERVAFVLHDLFAMPFDAVATIVGRSPMAARQLASRARRRVRGAAVDGPTDRDRKRELVDAFLAASRNGDIGALLAVLDPNVVLRADATAIETSQARIASGAPKLQAETRGAVAVADAFAGRARFALPALIDGSAGAVWASAGQTRAAFVFGINADRIVTLDIVMQPAHLDRLNIVIHGA